jgi:hypothetical protein
MSAKSYSLSSGCVVVTLLIRLAIARARNDVDKRSEQAWRERTKIPKACNQPPRAARARGARRAARGPGAARGARRAARGGGARRRRARRRRGRTGKQTLPSTFKLSPEITVFNHNGILDFEPTTGRQNAFPIPNRQGLRHHEDPVSS